MDNIKSENKKNGTDIEVFSCRCGHLRATSRQRKIELEGIRCNICGTEIKQMSAEEYNIIRRARLIRENAVYGAHGDYQMQYNGGLKKIDI